MRIKSSVILQSALDSIVAGEQQYACAAIMLVETNLRWEHNQDVKSNAMQIFSKQMPKRVIIAIRNNSAWWDKGSPERVEALQLAINEAESKGD